MLKGHVRLGSNGVYQARAETRCAAMFGAAYDWRDALRMVLDEFAIWKQYGYDKD